MRTLTFLLFVVIALLLGGTAQQWVVDTPGYVLIAFGENSYIMSLIIFSLLLVVMMVALYAVIHLVRRALAAPRDVMRWRSCRHRAKGARALQKGLIALAEGRWLDAEKTLAAGARLSDTPLLHYLGAARAAEALRLPKRSEVYLSLAEQADEEGAIAVGLARGERHILEGEFQKARQVLTTLSVRKPKNPEILRLQLELCTQLKAWRELLETLPLARRAKALTTDAAEALERSAYLGLLGEVNAGHPNPNLVWNEIPSNFRLEPELTKLHTQNLVVSGSAVEAEVFVRKQINRLWQPDLVPIYADIPLGDSSLQLKHAEHWLRTHDPCAMLLTSLGRICLRAKLWGKARTYFEEALGFGRDPELYRLLAETLAAMNKPEESARYSREGLLLATSSGSVTLLPAQ